MSEWRAQVRQLRRARLGYDNHDKRRVEHLEKLAANPAQALTPIEEAWLARLVHRYRQQIRRQESEATEGADGGVSGSHESEPFTPDANLHCSPTEQGQD